MIYPNPKYRIYIDEVGNNDVRSSDDPNHRYLNLTGLIFELDYVKNIVFPSIDSLKQKYFNHHPDDPIILHRKELVNQKYPFHVLKNPDTKKKFNKDLLELISSLEYTIISVTIDKKEHKEKYQTRGYDPYHYCMEVIIERYYFFLERINSIGDVMVESRGGKEDKRLKETFTRIYKNGTTYIEGTKIQKRLTSKELKVKPKSQNISGLQLADLLAHPIRRFMLKEYKNYQNKNTVFGDEIIKRIKDKFYKGKKGIEGYGIKFLP